jgi:hypothetical protein
MGTAERIAELAREARIAGLGEQDAHRAAFVAWARERRGPGTEGDDAPGPQEAPPQGEANE